MLNKDFFSQNGTNQIMKQELNSMKFTSYEIAVVIPTKITETTCRRNCCASDCDHFGNKWCWHHSAVKFLEFQRAILPFIAISSQNTFERMCFLETIFRFLWKESRRALGHNVFSTPLWRKRAAKKIAFGTGRLKPPVSICARSSPPTQPPTLSIACCKHMHDYMRGFHPNQKVNVHKKWDLWTKRRQAQHRQNMETDSQKKRQTKYLNRCKKHCSRSKPHFSYVHLNVFNNHHVTNPEPTPGGVWETFLIAG